MIIGIVSFYSYTPYYVAPEILSNDKYDKVIDSICSKIHSRSNLLHK